MKYFNIGQFIDNIFKQETSINTRTSLNEDCIREAAKHTLIDYKNNVSRYTHLLNSTGDKAIPHYKVVLSDKAEQLHFLKGGRVKTRRTLKYMIKQNQVLISALQDFLNYTEE
jgi:hypothetical protein